MNLLAPFGIIYGRIVDLRNYLYDRGVFKSHDLGARTISIGNLTIGGTGKTPLVALVAAMLAENGEKVCILSRGYGRKNEKLRVLVSDGEAVLADAETAGDEPVELARKLIGKAIVISNANRVAAAKWAKEKFGITAFVLDDGFQHLRARRDLDIVCIDATNPCGNGRTLPAGILRESLKSVKRADVIVITRSDQTEQIEDVEARLRKINGSIPMFRSTSQIEHFCLLEEFLAKTQRTQSEIAGPLFAFCGVGNPDSFFGSLEKAGVELSGKTSFADHHKYHQADLERIESEARRFEAAAVITTAKDAVKLKGLKFNVHCYVAVARTEIEDFGAFRKLVIASS